MSTNPSRSHGIHLYALACLGACGGGAPADQKGGMGLGPSPEPRTEAVLVGPLCHGEECQCREKEEDDAGSPEPGHKRFEIRLGPSDDPLWATVDGMVLHKTGERADACFYVDLEPGDHKVELRGTGDDALSIGMAIAEQGGAEDQTWWYRTFDFQCGTPGQCDMETLESWKRDVTALKGKHDPCGSTKVKGIGWETGRMPDRAHPGELLLRLTLDVYKFTPENPPGTSDCDKGEGAGPAE